MYIVTAAEMRQAEEHLFRTVPPLEVMERAGQLLAMAAVQRSAGPYAVVCGKGNNGGDGLAAARHLHRLGRPVTVVMRDSPSSLSADAAAHHQRVREASIPVVPAVPAQPALLIDCVLGTGVRGPVRGEAVALIEQINAAGRPVLSADLPSGVETDTGRADGPAVRADWTVAIGLPKWGHVLYPGALKRGRLLVADIGLTDEALAALSPGGRITLPGDLQGWLPRYGAGTHKGSRGRVVVVGGSRGMTGAPSLAGLAALRAGAGLVTVVVPPDLQPVVAALAPEYMTGTPDELDRLLGSADAAAIGPGIGRSPWATELVRRWVVASPAPVVLDADGLHAFAGDPGRLQQAAAPLVLTPHPGELAALLGTSTEAVQRERAGAALRAAQQAHAAVLLKGACTLIATPDGQILANDTGNRALATGGTGDVLTGLIAGLLAQGLEPVRAAAAGAFLHGLAAERWSEANGPDGMLAGDLLPLLPPVQDQVRQGAVRGVLVLRTAE